MPSRAAGFLLILCLSCGASTIAAAADPSVITRRVPDHGLEPRAAVDSAGTIHLIYFAGDPQHGDVFYVKSSDGGEHFSPPIRVNSGSESALIVGGVRGPQMALGTNGRVHVVWYGSGKAAEKSPVARGLPLLYARLNDAGDAFEPQRNLLSKTGHLDGGGSIAADAKGHVYAAWHGVADKNADESARQVWLARSDDDGKTFSPETAADVPPTGACACCAIHLFLNEKGSPRVLYRSATQTVHRDIYLLSFEPPEAKKIDQRWIGTCVMSTFASVGEWLAWDAKDGVRVASTDYPARAQTLGRDNPKHPALAAAKDGAFVLAWTEKTAWDKGGSLAWQRLDAEGNLKDAGRADDLPAWDYPAAVALPDGRFVIFYEPRGRDTIGGHVPSRFATTVLLTLLLAASFLLKLNHLGHAGIKALDESFHALVAKNLLKHPLTPTLYDRTYVPHDYKEWQANHVWLHKPIVPLWQMALSMALLGTTTFAMRLPSAILSTAAVWLTYAIGFELFRKDRRPALIAATLQALNPAIVALVHGYVFSDHVDIAFLFWVEVAVWCLVRAVMREGASMRWTIAAGIAQGIAFLSKTYPAFIVTGIALIAVLMPLAGFADQSAQPQPSPLSHRFRWKHLLVLLGATIVTIAPWTISCMIRFPQEFWWEQAQVFRHLGTNVENWAAPWDRLIFDYLVNVYHLIYPAVIVATIVVAPRVVRERNAGLLLLYAWGIGVLVPHVLATSKTPSATLIGWPAFLLLLGAMIVRAIDGDAWCLGGWLAAAVLAVAWPGVIRASGFGYPDPPRAGVLLRQNRWVVEHVAIALAVALGGGLALRGDRLKRLRAARMTLITLASVATLFLALKLPQIAWRITNNPRGDRPAFGELAAFVHARLPGDAVLLLESREKDEHIIAMFWIDRTVYTVGPNVIAEMARLVREGGGTPYLVTNRSVPLPALTDEFLDGLRVYMLPASALQQSR